MGIDRRAAVVLTMTITLFSLAAEAPGTSPQRGLTERGHDPALASSSSSSSSSSDLLGNEVTAAVATYKLDRAGLLYEEHSPQTELPRLGEPKS